MKGIEGASNKPERKLVKTGINEAGYPVYERRTVSKRTTRPETKTTEWLDTEQRKILRTVLFSFGITLSPMKDQRDTSQYAEPFDEKEKVETVYHNLKFQNATAAIVTRPALEVTPQIEREAESDEFAAEIEKYMNEIDPVNVALIKQYANKSVVGAPEFTRMEYVQEKVQFAPWNEEKETGVPPVVEAELRMLLPGLCAQESGFVADKVSSAGAVGIFQIMPENIAHYEGNVEDATSLVKQVEMVGVLLSDMYRQLFHHLGEEVVGTLQHQFGNEVAFQKDLIVPLLLNSYNAGAARVAEAVRLYLEKNTAEELPTGKDLFLAIADFAQESEEGKYQGGYREDARDYVFKIYALKEALGDEDYDFDGNQLSMR